MRAANPPADPPADSPAGSPAKNAAGAGAPAQLDAEWLDATIAQLNDDSFIVREAASKRLAEAPSLSLDRLEARLAEGGLSPEQQSRLNRAALERFAALPRAGLGVRFGPPIVSGGVPLGSVLDDFPAAAVLRGGDIVVSINDQPVESTNQMGALILSHQPGQVLRMVVDRPPPLEELPGAVGQPERLTLEVPLGDYADLATGVELTPDRLDDAFHEYKRRLGIDRDPVSARVGDELAPLQWLKAEGYDHTVPSAPVGAFEPVPAWRYISFAGQPSSWNAAIDLRRGDPSAMTRRVMVGLQANGDYSRLEEALAGYRAMLLRVVEIDDQIKSMQGGIARAFDQARFDRVQAERAELMQGIQEIAAELNTPPGLAGD